MLMQVVEQVSTLVQPFADLYADSKVLVVTATTLHIGGLMAGGGLAIATDRTILGTSPTNGTAQRAIVAHVAATHKFVITSLVLIITSGLMFLAADAKTFLASPVYWSKMALVALLAFNGSRLWNTEKKLTAAARTGDESSPLPASLWNSLRARAVTSVVAWFTILVLGVVLANS